MNTSVLYILLLLYTIAHSRITQRRTCPIWCECHVDSSDGTTRVVCTTGGLTDRTFAKLMSAVPEQVNILQIAAPRSAPNRFMITQDFERFGSLTDLHLVNCGIRTLGKRTFENVKTLRHLNLAQNQISSISPDTFANTEHLAVLNMSTNRLGLNTLTTGTFAHLTGLRTLDLSANGIQSFNTTGVFSGLVRLERLILDDNTFTSDTFDVLADMTNLLTLSLSRCRLSEIPSNAFERNPNLQILRLTGNKLKTSYIAATKNIKGLLTLDIGSNMISNIDDSTLDHVTELKELLLADNYIGASMSDDVFPYHRISEAYHGKPSSLQVIDLSANRLTDFKSYYLDASLVSSLTSLKLSSNCLLNITEEQTANMANLKRLYMSDVNLTSLPYNLPQEYSQLEHLDLSRNQLSTLTASNVISLRSLKSLNLSDNNFSSLYDYQRRFLANLLHVDVSGNPWDCSRCRTLRNLHLVIKNHSDSSVLCAFPPEAAGKPIAEVLNADASCSKTFASSELAPQSDVGILVAGVCSMIFVLTFTTLVLCCYFWRRSNLRHLTSTRSQNKKTANGDETATLSSSSGVGSNDVAGFG